MDNDTVTLVVEARSFNFSKTKLAERSHYFNIMFNGNFIEKHQSVIELQGVSSFCWEQILHYLKYGQILRKDRITVPELLSLLDAATMYQITDLQEVVTKSVFHVLSMHNAFEVLEMASRLDATRLIKKARAIALWMFDDATKLETFFKLKAAQVEGYLSDKAINTTAGEMGVWDAINRWLNCNPEGTFEDRLVYLPRLIKCLCLNSLTWRELKTIKMHKTVQACPFVLNVITKITNERDIKDSSKKVKVDDSLGGEDADETAKFIAEWEKTEPRKLPLVPSVVGNVRTGPDTVSPCILKFCETEKRYIPVLRLTKVENSLGCMVGFKIVAHGSKLFMLGGEMMTRQSAWNHAVWMYDQIFGNWTFLSNLLKPSRHVSACCNGDDLYILGGFGRHRVLQDAVYKFSIKDSTWTTCAPLPKAMYSVACCSFRGFIYVFETFIYQYIPESDMWVKLIATPITKGFTNAMPSEKYIYLAGAYTRNVYRFNPLIPQKPLELVGHFKNECVQACLVDDHIYSLSQDEFGEDIYCEKLNVVTGQRTVLFEGTTDSKIVDLNPRHHHGCFPLLCY